MYDKLKEIVCDGIDYYYNTGEYIFVFDPPEGGRIWIYRLVYEDEYEICGQLPFKILDEFIKFATYIKNLAKNKE